MKIAIVCYNLSWQTGGTRLVFSLARTFGKLGHEAVIYAPEFNKDTFPELTKGLNIKVVKPPASFLWEYSSDKLVHRVVQKWRQNRLQKTAARVIAGAMDKDFDVVNCHDFSYPVGYFYKKLNKGAKFIWTMNDPPFAYLPKENFIYDVLSRLYNWYKNLSEKRYWRAASRVVVWSGVNKAWVESQGLRGMVLWNCMDAGDFYAPVKDIAARKDGFTLLSVGALNKYRRFEDTILAAKKLREAGYKAKVAVVCKNVWHDDGYENELREFVKDNGMSDGVDLFFEGLSEDDLKKMYASSDFFVLPIYVPPPRHGFSSQYVAFEAMAAGLPLIVCNTLYNAAEVLSDGENALFVDPMSPEQIAEKVKTLVDNPVLYKRMASAGQNFTKENVSWEEYARGMLE